MRLLRADRLRELREHRRAIGELGLGRRETCLKRTEIIERVALCLADGRRYGARGERGEAERVAGETFVEASTLGGSRLQGGDVRVYLIEILAHLRHLLVQRRELVTGDPGLGVDDLRQ